MTHQTNAGQSINVKQPIRALAQGLAEGITGALNAGDPISLGFELGFETEGGSPVRALTLPEGGIVAWAEWTWDFIGQIGGGLAFRTEGYRLLADAQGEWKPAFELELRFERLAREVSRLLGASMPPTVDELRGAVERGGAQLRLVDAGTGEEVPGAVFDFQDGRWTVDLGEGPERI